MNLEHKEFLDKGKRGFVYTATLDGKKVLVKEKNPEAGIDTVEHEANMTKKLNKIGVGPMFIAFENDALIREFVDGVRIEEFLETASDNDAKNIIRQVLKQCHAMDKVGINKFEMTHPYKHILISEDLNATMIDFERCKHSVKPKNVTQVCQYIARIAPLLKKSGVQFDIDEVKRLGMEYKIQGYSDEVFDKLVNIFS